MRSYRLTQYAEKDLREIARYTLLKWGAKSLESYRQGLKATFKAIAKSEVVSRQFSKNIPQVLVTKYRFHFIFYIAIPGKEPVIIGIVHEKMDIVKRLTERLT